MEKNASLLTLDREMCNYYLTNNYTKTKNLTCYQTDKKQIAEFYSHMAQHFIQTQGPPRSPSKSNNHRLLRIQSHIQHSINNPIVSALPKQIVQNNQIQVAKADKIQVTKASLFSQVEATKNAKYLIAKEVRAMLSEDIEKMRQQKAQTLFRKKFPQSQKQLRTTSLQSVQIEAMIKEYNRMLVRFKNIRPNTHSGLSLVDKESNFDDLVSSAGNLNDQKFRILSLFKKMYVQTSNQAIDSALMNYIMKFIHHDTKHKTLHTRTNNKTASVSQIATPAKALRRQSIEGLISNTGSKLQRPSSKIGTQSKTNLTQFSKQSKDPNIKQTSKQQTKLRSRTSHQSKKAKLII